MPLYAVSLLFSLQVQASDAPQPLQEITIHVLSAADEDEAKARGRAIGKKREITYKNSGGEDVRDIFKSIVELQELLDDHFFDGMEVASWMFRKGETIIIDERGIRHQGTTGE